MPRLRSCVVCMALVMSAQLGAASTPAVSDPLEVIRVASPDVDGVAIQVAHAMLVHTDAMRMEVCASICQSTQMLNEWVVPITTSGSALMCMASSSSCPSGTQSIGVTIHTHVGGWTLPVRAVDAERWPDLVAGTTVTLNPYIFSDEDLTHATAYLVTPAQHVWVQHEGQPLLLCDFSTVPCSSPAPENPWGLSALLNKNTRKALVFDEGTP